MSAVSLSPLFNGWQGFSPSGIPLSLGTIDTYQAGTSAPLATYTTSAGNIANSNPIVLDAGGRPSQEIWLTEGSAYRFVLKDALGNQLGSYDNIIGIGDAANDLETRIADPTSASNGGALVGHYDPLAPTYLKTVSDIINGQPVNVLRAIPKAQWAGIAAGTSTYDASTNVSDLVAAMDAAKRGWLIFPRGTTRANRIPFRNNMKYQGEAGAVVKGYSGNNIFGEATPAAAYTGIIVCDLEIDGNAASVSFPSDDEEGNAFRLNQVSFSKFYNLNIHDTVFNALSVYNLSNDNDFYSIRMASIGKSGTPPGAFTFNGIFFEAGSSRNKLDRFTINTARGFGVWMGARSADSYDNKISNGWIASTTQDGIRIGDDATSNVCYRPIVSNVSVLSAGDIGIRLYHAGTGSIVGGKVLGGHVESCTNRGLLIDTAAADTTVDGVTVKNNGSYGITIAGSNSDVRNCKVYGHGVRNVDDQSSTTQLFANTNNGSSDSQSGTFTPTVLLGGAAVGLTFTSRSGVYQREGRRIKGRISIVMLTKGSSTGVLTIGNLPFTSKASGPLGYANVTVANMTYAGIPMGLILNSSSAISLYSQASGAGSSTLSDAALANNTEFYIEFEYDV